MRRIAAFELVHVAQPDVLAIDPSTGAVPKRDRRLKVDIWYPADIGEGTEPEP